MYKPLVLLTGIFFAFSPLNSALAVDVVNQDEMEHTITIGVEDSDEKKFVLGPGEALLDACEACIVRLGEDELMEAEDDDIVEIKAGKLLIRDKTI